MAISLATKKETDAFDKDYTIGLKSTLASDSSADFGDVIQVKKALSNLGYYTPNKKIGESEDKFSPYADFNIFNSIGIFQKDKGLRFDEIIKKGGETERAVNNIFKKQKREDADEKSGGRYGDSTYDGYYKRVRGKEGIGFTKKNKLGTNIDQDTHTGITGSFLGLVKAKRPEKNYSPLESLREDEIEEIYYNDVYKQYNIDKIEDTRIGETLFDTLTNHSPTAPIKWLQEGINTYGFQNIDVDGALGKQTYETLNNLDENTIKNINNDFTDKRHLDLDKQIEKDPSKKLWRGLRSRFDSFRIN